MSNHNMYFSKTCACQKRMSKPPKNSKSWCVGEAPMREVIRNIKAETVRQGKTLLFPPEFTEWQVLGCLELHGEILPQKLFSYTR